MSFASYLWNRRRFLQTAGSATALAFAAAQTKGFSSKPAPGISLILDSSDEISTSSPVQWAAGELQHTLERHAIAVTRCDHITSARPGDLCLVASSANASLARRILQISNSTLPFAPESLGLMTATLDDKVVLLACSHDVRGLVYALLELSDRVLHSEHPAEALTQRQPLIEHPANRVRGVIRLFVSDVEDKPWFNDRTLTFSSPTHFCFRCLVIRSVFRSFQMPSVIITWRC
jgi:hypothetical protein